MAKRRGRRQPATKGSATSAPPTRHWNWPLLAFLAIVFILKAIVLSQLQHHPLLEPEGGVDSSEYVRLARRVLEGDLLLGPGLYYLSPLYVYFLAALLALSDSFLFVRIVQIALGTGAVACVFLTARTWFGQRAAWIAAALAALTGVFNFYEIVIFQSSIDVFLTAAALSFLASGLQRRSRDLSAQPRTYRTAASGLLFGVQVMNRPNIAMAIAGLIVVLLATRRWRAAAVMAAGVMIALTPLAIRNVIVARQFALTSSQGGLNFYIGNHEGATGQYVAVPGVRANMAGQFDDTRKVAEAAMGHALSDGEVSSYFTRQATAWIRGYPVVAARLLLRKLALTFNARHQWLDYSYPYYARDTGSLLGALIVGPWLLVPLACLGTALLLTASPISSGAANTGFWVWWSFVPFYALSVAVFFVAERYRLPLFVPLCVLSGAALDALTHVFPTRSSVLTYRSGAAALALVAGIAVASWPFQLDDGRFEERLRLAKALMNAHDYGAAAVELERALAIRPADLTTEFNLGMAQTSNGQIQQGLAHVRHAVDAGVPMPGARYALAGAMLQTGDREGAVALLRTFFPAPDDTADSCYQVALLALSAGAPRVAERYAQRALELRPGWPEAMDLLQRLR